MLEIKRCGAGECIILLPGSGPAWIKVTAHPQYSKIGKANGISFFC